MNLINIYTNKQINMLYKYYLKNMKNKDYILDWDFNKYVKKHDVVGFGWKHTGYILCKYIKGYYIPTHNATRGIRAARLICMKMLKEKMNILFFVPDSIGKILIKLGYERYSKIYNSEFRSRPMLKRVYTTDISNFDNIEYIMFEYNKDKISTIGVVDPESETYWEDVVEYIKIIKEEKNKNVIG